MKRLVPFLLVVTLSLGQQVSGRDFSYMYQGQTLYFNYVNGSAQVTSEILQNPYYYHYPTGAVVIPDSVPYSGTMIPVTSIGAHAFAGCSGVTSLFVPPTVTSIDRGAFSGCRGLTSIAVANGNPVYDSRNGCNAIIETASGTLVKGSRTTIIPNDVKAIGPIAFSGLYGLTSIVIPDSVATIGGSAFSQCEELDSVVMGRDVKRIEEGVFAGCSSLTSIVIPDSVVYLGRYVFTECPSLTAITLGASVDTIESGAFYNCVGLRQVVLPASVTYIGQRAFYECRFLSTLTSLSTIPPAVGSDAFFGVSSLIPLYVPVGYVDVYRVAEGWDYFSNIHELPEVGIRPSEAEGHTRVYVRDGRILFEWPHDAVQPPIHIYDAAGRLMDVRRQGDDTPFVAPVPGVYIVKVGNAPARKVVVTR